MILSAQTCRMQALSNDYFDYIGELPRGSALRAALEDAYCTVRATDPFLIIYEARNGREATLSETYYSAIPKCYGLADLESLTAAGIDRVWQYPGLSLLGENIIVGFLDTGIDYTHPAFLKEDGTTRIIGIWDQEEQSGMPPEGFFYGSSFDSGQINRALTAEEPLSQVPSVDEDGHGTAVAAAAAGSSLFAQGFSGAAPRADIAVVKLKQAKEYLREFYCIREGAVAFQENDIMLGVRYLSELALKQEKPLVLCIALSTSQGDHAGNGALPRALSAFRSFRQREVVIATGNEANAGHHYRGSFSETQDDQDVEIRVGEGERGFVTELWGATPGLYGVSVISPSGEQIPRVPIGIGQNEQYRFVFENTTLQVEYRTPEGSAGDPLVFLRFVDPAPGIWIIRVSLVRTGGANEYHLWLPIQQFLSSNTYFLQSDPDMTLTEPSAAGAPISIGAYDAATGALDIHSGRGYNRRGQVKPELCAPGVGVYTALPGGLFGARTGTSMAAAIAAGGVALLMEWEARFLETDKITPGAIKSDLIGGAGQDVGRVYPNPAWGYGTIDIYGALEQLRIR